MVKSEEIYLFWSNCFVWMTSADHEVTTGKLAPWGEWNEISYQPTSSSSFQHLVPFVICKAKEMFCSPWFFSPFFFPSGEWTIHLTGFSKVSAVASGLFGTSVRSELFILPPLSASHQPFSHLPLGSLETCFRRFENPWTSQGKKTSINVGNVNFTNSSTTAMALLSWFQNHGRYNLFSISQCGYPAVTLLLLASLRSEGFRGRKCWCGREMMRGEKWVNVWESDYSMRRFPSPSTGLWTDGARMATAHKNREQTWKVKAPREGSKREWLGLVAGEHLK